FNWSMEALLLGAKRTEYVPARLDFDQFEKLRTDLMALRRQWNDLPAGETMELTFQSAKLSTCEVPVAPKRA
ncbi:MAG: hypothetical protein ABI647_16705, partial [Gemmatimonadota bacterium]